MYSYLWLRLRKALKGAWFRYNSSKRERTTSFSSLQECLDHQPSRRGLWRNWFLLLLIAPLVYYVTLIFIIWDDRPVVITASSFFAANKCLGHQSDCRGLWRKWFLLLLVAPLVYYVTFMHIIWDESPVVITASRSEQQVTENITETSSSKNYLDNPITPKVVNEVTESHIRFHSSRFEDSYDGSYYNYVSRIGQKTDKAIPWCNFKPDAIQLSGLEVKINDVTISQWYRQLVNQGGSFSPSYCIPRHKVAIIVPYRDRPSNLAVFLLTIHPFLIDQLLEYRIFVVEQSGKDLFNKGRLFNAGFAEAMKLGDWHCLIFHDVDLLPMSKQILYSCPLWPRHMCPTLVENGKTVWNFHSYFGGVSAMSVKHFKNVNGFSNMYWGWGGEDTDMFWRIRGAGLLLGRYQKDVAKYLTLPHKKGPECVNRNELIKTAIGRYPYDGLTTLKYRVISMKLLHVYTHILIDINPTTDEATIAS